MKIARIMQPRRRRGAPCGAPRPAGCRSYLTFADALYAAHCFRKPSALYARSCPHAIVLDTRSNRFEGPKPNVLCVKRTWMREAPDGSGHEARLRAYG